MAAVSDIIFFRTPVIEAHGISDAGPRPSNDDRILVDSRLGLYAVCDGMGGHRQGGFAAEIAIAAIRHFADVSQERLEVSWPFGYDMEQSPDNNRLQTGMKLANRQVWRRAEQSIECAGMGTTIAAILINDSQAILGNVGDSRIYRMRDGQLVCLSVDDTVVASMVQRGIITPEEAWRHPMRNILTHAAGSQDGLEVHLSDEVMESGDLFVICSDGLHGSLKSENIAEILRKHEDEHNAAETCAAQLITEAKEAGALDNVSAVVLRNC